MKLNVLDHHFENGNQNTHALGKIRFFLFLFNFAYICSLLFFFAESAPLLPFTQAPPPHKFVKTIFPSKK